MNIPEKISDYNVYDDTNKLVGISGEVTLPKLEALTSTVSGAGILGEIESSNPGHFGSTTVEFAWRTLFDKSFRLATYTGKPLVLRAAKQNIDSTSGKISHTGLKITLKWMPKALELGKLAQNSETESKSTLEVFYIKIEDNGKILLELDKLNSVYKVNGVDQLASIKKLI